MVTFQWVEISTSWGGCIHSYIYGFLTIENREEILVSSLVGYPSAVVYLRFDVPCVCSSILKMPTAYVVGSLGAILRYETRSGGIHASLCTCRFIFEVSCKDGFWVGSCCQLGASKRYSCCFTHCGELMIGLKTSKLITDLRPVEVN